MFIVIPELGIRCRETSLIGIAFYQGLDIHLCGMTKNI